ncbi:hypothetical protein [Haloarcula onubensis]|uniref:Uncharacterized protein n=1 Tax=Haloarcula onubensis TaxID=2950539 RepID=A0ABU2FP47_9EURY|nr:hypothetical protein [Halomicroarcula sp. S3CR25-11]MDS0282533.1 hypothetical protein [Halomicroarcula sp. S3CR25-11]
MSASQTVSRRSLRRWLMATTFLLGLAVVAIAAVGYRVSPFANPLVFSVTGVGGGVVAAVAGLRLLGSLLTLFGNDAPGE